MSMRHPRPGHGSWVFASIPVAISRSGCFLRQAGADQAPGRPGRPREAQFFGLLNSFSGLEGFFINSFLGLLNSFSGFTKLVFGFY